MKRPPLSHYLQTYAEVEVAKLVQFAPFTQVDTGHFDHCVVIPAYNEAAQFLQRLCRHPQAAQTLLILVINQPDNTDDEQHNAALLHAAKALDRHLSPRSTDDGRLTLIRSDTLTVLVVNRFQGAHKIPAQQGVGLARKIGCDLACQLRQQGVVRDRWMYCTDADTHLPDNYFSPWSGEASARLFDFQHGNDGSAVAQATQHYERAIKYYRDALGWADSPYAFCALGSTLALTFTAYAQVRGVPKRAGGEDFYLLNKLAKVGKIVDDRRIHLQIDARVSTRVPFGTGPAVQRLLADTPARAHSRYYNFAIFICLKHWLHWATQTLPAALMRGEAQATIAHLPTPLHSAWQALNLPQFLQHAEQQCRQPQQVSAQFHQWFDGFKTLKFVHHLQAQAYADTPLTQGLHALNHQRNQHALPPIPATPMDTQVNV